MFAQHQTEGVIHADCRDVLPTLPSNTFDLVFCDPPYPNVNRQYGTWTESEWHYLMDAVVPQCRRILKPTGSAVFLLQPNSVRAGRMRTWHLEFVLKWAREWGWVQDAYWLNTCALPLGGACKSGLMRGALKHVVWLGLEDCYRDQTGVLFEESQANRTARAAARLLSAEDREAARRRKSESRRTHNGTPVTDDAVRLKEAAGERGGTTPFNVLVHGGGSRGRSGQPVRHPATTPLEVTRFWLKYACPPGGLVLDCFAGSGTTAQAAREEGRRSLMVEKEQAYCAMMMMHAGIAAGEGKVAA